MMVDTKNLVPMTEANQNFSRVVRMVDESGLAGIPDHASRRDGSDSRSCSDYGVSGEVGK